MKSPTAPYPSAQIEELFDAILTLETKEEAKNFFRDLLTIAELTEFANRWQIVKLLVAKKSYLEIAQTLNVSTTTVARVAHWWKNGAGGYELLANRMFSTKKLKDYHEPPRYNSGKLRGLRNTRSL